ncbi:MAG: hypothetical protein KCHDKBKB_02349 [Elusimicrobia bacterium]|nr:hypothetical protein [Elusimicrobiota bacterium]
MMKNCLRTLSTFIAIVLLFGCGGSSAIQPTEAAANLTGVVQTLIDLLNKQDTTKITADDYESTSLGQIITFGTPMGYRLKLRYLDFGMALVDALKTARDPELRRRMIEMVQWTRDPKVRAEAIITLSALLDPTHKKYFKEAILDSNVGIRFAAVEALQMWGQPEAIPLLTMARDRDFSPLMQIYSAQALLSLGDTAGLAILWKHMDHESWVVRAMAARYLGDYADADAYVKMNSYLTRETKNDFVIAELCIASLKLISKKGEKVSYSPASPGWKKNSEVTYTIGKDNVIELEPLIIVPPQLRIPPSLQVAAQINTKLLRLITERLKEPLDPLQAQDPVLQDLNAMVTPTGFALKTRYSELSYLVIEALAGTNDSILRLTLQRLAADDSNPLIRASALIALAYSRNVDDLYLIEEALADKNATARMGALEALEVGRFRQATPRLFATAANDPSPALRVYALNILCKFDNPSGRQSLLNSISDPDWPSRAMAFWTLGKYGAPEDYTVVLSRLPTETNPFVQAEIVLAALRLAPLE